MTKENTYWNNRGKHQDLLEKLEDVKPSCGYTDNPYLNLFIEASFVYYDVYNNGGCNLNEEDYYNSMKKYIYPFNDKFEGIDFDRKYNTIYRNMKNTEKLERFMDSVITLVSEQDLSYNQSRVFYNNESRELSRQPKLGFTYITFGNKETETEWLDTRLKNLNYKLI